MPSVPEQSRGHCAHIGQLATIHYRWHPLYGRSVRRILTERRTSGEVSHVELAPGNVIMVAAWKLDPITCASIKVGAPQVSLAALHNLHELLVTCESRLNSTDDNTVKEEVHDGIARTAHSKDKDCFQTDTKSSDNFTPNRSCTRRCETIRDDADAAPGCSQVAGAAAARSGRRRNTGDWR
jgi:hypothetical protein